MALLVAGVVVSAGLALVRGGWELHLAAHSLLAIYVAWLLELKHKRAERRRRLRALEARLRMHRPEPLRPAAGDD